MGYYKDVMNELQSKKCQHRKDKQDLAMCSDCYIEIAKEKVCSWRNKTYKEKTNEIK